MWLWPHYHLFEPWFPEDGYEGVGAGRLLDYLYGLWLYSKQAQETHWEGEISGNGQDFKLQSSPSHAASQNMFVFKNLTSKLAFTLHVICSKTYMCSSNMISN